MLVLVSWSQSNFCLGRKTPKSITVTYRVLLMVAAAGAQGWVVVVVVVGRQAGRDERASAVIQPHCPPC